MRDLPDLLRPGDALVLNDTRVIPAALAGERVRGEARARVSFNLNKRVDESRWRAFARPAKRLAVGDHVRFGTRAGLLRRHARRHRRGEGRGGRGRALFQLHGAYLDQAIAALGDMPLPPYIALQACAGRRPTATTTRRSTPRREGAVAAPTAGLHFTPDCSRALEARGISRHFVTLHVGAGTFLPVKAEDTAEHRMHAEWGEISAATAAASTVCGRAAGASSRSARRPCGCSRCGHGRMARSSRSAGETSIFITPGYRFRAVDLLMTNFHLPRSTLFMLVAAFAGLETMQAAYAHAIAAGYRFYSYGDACLLILRRVRAGRVWTPGACASKRQVTSGSKAPRGAAREVTCRRRSAFG